MGDERYAGLSDKRAILQVLGCLLLDSTLIEDVDRPLDKEDFSIEMFYRYLYVAIFNLHYKGVEKIDEYAIDSYLSKFPDQYKVFEANKGLEWISDAMSMAQLSNYDYWYHRVRKFSLLRYYEKNGLDTRSIYDGNTADANNTAEENLKFDNLTEQGIVDWVNDHFVAVPEVAYCGSQAVDSCQAGEGMLELIDELLETPDYGYPMASLALNTLTRGLRPGTLTIRAATSGAGKTRNFLMDACNLAVPYVYDEEKGDFVYTGHCVPTLFYGIEMSLREYKSIIIAAVSKVNESHIIKGTYEEGELERVRKAAQYIQESPLELIHCDDYTIREVENTVKKYILQKGIEVFIFDYIQTTARLNGEESQKSSIRLQEYQVLVEFSRRLKALAERTQIAVLAGVQLKPDSKDLVYKDEQAFAGSKQLVFKIDAGVILSKPREIEKKKLEKITRHMIMCPEINLLQWCFKIRGGELTSIIVCSNINLGTMTIKDIFVTDYDFNLINIDFTKIEQIEEVIKKQAREIKVNDEDEGSIQNEEIETEDEEKTNNEYSQKRKVIF